jgi:hypothetical protein
MTPMRFLRTSAVPGAVLAVLAVLTVGCTSASSAASTQSPAPAQSTVATATARPVVYLADGGSVTGTALRAPACRSGCVLSGDSTVALWDMTWTAWGSAQASGTGTEKLDDCDPNCASGTVHAVPARVVLGDPVLVCVSGTARWLWSRVSFVWPDGLPAALSGANAPVNPLDYPDITAQSAKSCP